jgi:hypothetical protein
VSFRTEPHRKEEIALHSKAKPNANSESNAANNRISTGSEMFANGGVETFGEAMPGLMLESVVDPDHPGHLLLHTWDGRRTTTARKIEHGGVSYIPKNLASGLVQSVRFAPPSLPFGSTAKIISSLRDFLSTYARLQPEVADLLVAFGLATWFCDCMSVAPVLHLFGPCSAVSQVLRLLGCLCRRPILLGDVDFEGLATLPNRLGATLLINQRDLGRRVRRALLASNRRHFCVVRGRGRLDLYAAKAFSCEDFRVDEHGLRVSISPAQDPLPCLTDSEEGMVAQSFQTTLLRYRMVYFEKVRANKVDCSAFVPEMREEASSWLAPIFDCRALSNSVSEEILRQSREAAGARFFDPKCVVAEVALFFCHKPDTAHFSVGELAEKINDLLQGRHEEPRLSPKRVGLVLRELGIHGDRVTEGYRIILTDVIREQIHQLAFDYRVPTLDDGVPRCRYCRNGSVASQRTQ